MVAACLAGLTRGSTHFLEYRLHLQMRHSAVQQVPGCKAAFPSMSKDCPSPSFIWYKHTARFYSKQFPGSWHKPPPQHTCLHTYAKSNRSKHYRWWRWWRCCARTLPCTNPETLSASCLGLLRSLLLLRAEDGLILQVISHVARQVLQKVIS